MMPEKWKDLGDIPEADLADQLTPIDPSDSGEEFENYESAPSLVNDADWIDQQLPVPLDDPEWEER